MKPIPREILLTPDGGAIKIVWKDGVTSQYPLSNLRAACPCALCKGHHPSESLNLSPEDFPDIELVDVEVVGRYAYRFIWSDGHDKGIYEFEWLRRIGESDVQ